HDTRFHAPWSLGVASRILLLEAVRAGMRGGMHRLDMVDQRLEPALLWTRSVPAADRTVLVGREVHARLLSWCPGHPPPHGGPAGVGGQGQVGDYRDRRPHMLYKTLYRSSNTFSISSATALTYRLGVINRGFAHIIAVAQIHESPPLPPWALASRGLG